MFTKKLRGGCGRRPLRVDVHAESRARQVNSDDDYLTFEGLPNLRLASRVKPRADEQHGRQWSGKEALPHCLPSQSLILFPASRRLTLSKFFLST